MATPTYSYTPTSPAKITKALSDIFVEMQQSGQQEFTRSANTNVMIAVSSAGLLDDLEATIDALSLVHPSRFFVVFVDDRLAALTTEISARCHGLSKSEHVCSEIVRIGAPRSQLWLVPSVVRGNFLTGTHTELFLYDGGVSRELLDRLAPLADLIVYDSENFSGRVDMISETARLSSNLIDLQWIGLGPWRDEIKSAFAKPSVREHLPGLTTITVKARGGSRETPPFAALLLGGWIVDRLGLTHVMGRHGALHAHFPGGGGREVALCFESTGGAVDAVTEVSFSLSSSDGRAGAIRFVLGKGIETIVECGRPFRSSRPFEEENRDALIRRYFLIGESTANYNASLRMALHLRQVE